MEILKELIKEVDKGLFITINQPYLSLKKILKDNGINIKKMYFIDMISATTSTNPERTNECLFISSPSDLTDLGISIDQSLTAMGKGKKLLFVDNLSTFLIYNNTKVMAEFTHFLINKLRIHEVIGVIISIQEEMGSEFITKIESFCDDIIRMGSR